MSQRLLRVAVLSDLHFGSTEKGRDHTHVIVGDSAVPRQHPYQDLRTLIREHGLKADVILCPGDITLQADGIGLEQAWQALNQLTDDLCATHLLATTGNHDISSRVLEKAESNPEIWERLKQLKPSYPYPQGTRTQHLEYWAEHFFVAHINGVRFFVLNSCNCHARGEREYLHGRVTDYTISLIEQAAKVQCAEVLNVLLCHHHPVKQAELSQFYPDYSEMVQGRRLLSALEASGLPWLVIHGHKHSPRIEYAQGASGDAPIIFSAGSLSAVLSPAYFPAGRNQFYIVEIDLDYVQANGVAGVVQSWDWVLGRGWFAAKREDDDAARITTGAGFGYRFNARDARTIDKHFDGKTRIDWADVAKEFDYVKYLTPEDLKRLLDRLSRDHALEANWSVGQIFPTELLRRLP